jgi:hypothetical protein
MMLRLFALRTLSTKRLVPNLYFPSKPLARAERDRLNKQDANSVCISYGPDHRHFTA